MERWPVLPVGASDRHRWSAGLRPASRGSAKPAPTTLRPTPIPHGAPASDRHRCGSAKPAPTTLRRQSHMERRSPTGIARERETRTDDGAPYRREWRTPCSIRTAPLAPLRGAVPTGGRRSRAGASSFPGGVRAETGVIRELGDTPFAALRAAVPTGGRRSLAGGSSFPGGVLAETGVIRELGDTRFRDPAGVYGRAFRMGLEFAKQ